MTDIYVSHPNKSELEAFAANFRNSIPVVQGRAAIEASEEMPAQPACGDPSLFYTCVRASVDITPLIEAPFEIVDPELGAQLVGVWA